MIINKDISIINLISKLKVDLNGFILNDYWDCDLFAVGVTTKCSEDKIAYISTLNKLPGIYHLDIDLEEDSRKTIFTSEHIEYEELLEVLIKYLNC